MNNIESMKLALEALEEAKLHIWLGDEKGVAANVKCHQTITSLRQAIEQAQQAEPVAFINIEERKLEWAKYFIWDTPTVINLPKIPLYTSPPVATNDTSQERVDKTNKSVHEEKV